VETAQEVLRLKEISRSTRRLILESLAEAGSGHPGGSLSAVELLVTLYFHVMQHDPKNPKWEDRDRFFLSKGHAAPLLYAAVVTNVEGIGVKRWRHFRDLFVAALLDAYMHTTLLQREAPTDARFPAAARALRQTYERVRHYVHSKAK
jgi:pyruvate dehydrogenase complex dehydrogenase (E1) component